MITFVLDGRIFGYRVGGVCIEEEHVLLQGAEGEDFWTLPGGRCEFGETSTEALRRELREELGLGVSVGRLLWVVENFFEFGGKEYHEIGLYFAVSLPAERESVHRDEVYDSVDGDLSILFRWFALSGLQDVRLVPSFLVNRLMDLPAVVQHIEHRGA